MMIQYLITTYVSLVNLPFPHNYTKMAMIQKKKPLSERALKAFVEHCDLFHRLKKLLYN